MPTSFKLSGTSFNQDIISQLTLKQDVHLENGAISDEDLSEVEDLDGGACDPPIKCLVHNNLVGYVPKEHKRRVRELIKGDKKFSIYRLNTFKDNPMIGVRLLAS